MEKLSPRMEATHVALDLEASDVTSCLQVLVQHLVNNREINEELARKLGEELLNRERIGGTCVGSGVAVPHAYFREMTVPILLIGRLREAIDYHALDGQLVDLVFLLAGPLEAQRQHMKMLARIVRLLHDAQWLDELRAAKSPEDAIRAVQAVESRHA